MGWAARDLLNPHCPAAVLSYPVGVPSPSNDMHRMLKLQSKVARLIRNAEVVSFDVFDTAVQRKLDEPRSLFRLLQSGAGELLGARTDKFAAVRYLAEGEARRRAWTQGSINEITLDEIYAVIGEILDVEAEAIDELRRNEIRAELAVCCRDPFVHALYRQCIELDKSIVFLSDMYLPHDVIAEILANCGYTKFDALLVSSEERKTKASGALFDEALTRVPVPTDRWLHIGDNAYSDVAMARTRGLAAWRYRPSAEKFQLDSEQHRAWKFERPPTLAASVVKGLVSNRLTREKPPASTSTPDDMFWEDFGYSSAGPLYAGFVEWLFEQAARYGLQKLCFLARDGYIVKRLFEKYRPAHLASVETCYIYASRRALNIATIDALDERARQFLTQSYGLNRVGSFLRRVGLDPDAYGQEIRQAGFADERQFVRYGSDFEGLERLLKSVWAPIQEIARAERAVMQDYLRSFRLGEDRRIGLVDIGWQGSQQRAIQELLDCHGEVPAIHGFYLGTFWFASHLYKARLPNDAYLFNRGQPREFEDLVLSCVEIFELLFSSPEGSLVRIERGPAGEFVPIMQAAGPGDVRRNEFVERLQGGAGEFVEDYFGLKAEFPDLSIDPELALHQIGRVLRRPGREEAQHLGDIVHTKDFGESTPGPIAPASRLIDLLQRRRVIRKREGTWRAGIEARSSKLYSLLYRLRMRDLANR